MIGTKAIVAVALTGLGGITTGTAAYLEAHPSAFTHAETGQKAELLRPAPLPLVERSPNLDERSDVLVLEPVLITSRVGHRAVATVAVRAKPETENAPCSEWQDLANGPAGRRVRLLCQR
jgi:hypothetical protein